MDWGLLIKIPCALIVHFCQNSTLLALLKVHLSSDSQFTIIGSQEEIDSKEEPDDDDHDDLEIIDESETNITTSDPICSSGYPPEELMDRFSEIVKGRTYLHQPNQALNLYLTGNLTLLEIDSKKSLFCDFS